MKLTPFKKLIAFLESLEHFVLLETTKPEPGNRFSYLFVDPLYMMKLHPASINSFRDFWQHIESLTQKYYVAGYTPYETGYIIMDLPFPSQKPAEFESVFGVYSKPYVFDHLAGKFEGAVPPMSRRKVGDYEISNISIQTPRDRYIAAVECIRDHIAEGNTYQVNYTTRLDFTFSGSPIALYNSLRSAQPTGYSALMKYGEKWILSLSPELFFRIDGAVITSKPMKGTMQRGRTNAEDAAFAHKLQHDEKNRAENLIIVDLLRNDIGRIAETGSVKVPELLTVEKYRSVLQMTSTITGKLRRSVQLPDILEALFPCGSVTGAPKHRTMQIIQELEDSPRGVYTGAIGMINPGGDAVFNVPIRTIEIQGDRGSMGIGSGIVWNSDPGEEYEECLLKAQFLTTRHKPVELIESLRYERGYRRLDMHLNRLLDSAHYFDIQAKRDTIINALHRIENKLDKNSIYKVRITLTEDGGIDIDFEAIPAVIEQPVRLKICDTSSDSNDRFLFHKTNRRELYETEYRRAQEEGYFDVIFQNERGQITEGAITNLYIKKNDMLLTPPVECGLLNGVYRQVLLQKGKVKENVITIEDLHRAMDIYISNSVRGLIRGYIE